MQPILRYCNLFSLAAHHHPDSSALSPSSVPINEKERKKSYPLPARPSAEMRRLPAAPPRPLLRPHISPAPSSLGILRHHDRVAMSRTTPVVCCSCFLPNRKPGTESEPLRSRPTDRGRESAMARANPVAASGGGGGGGGGETSPSPEGGRNPLAPLAELWRRTVQPLGDYGFGKRSVWEGGVGLFMVSGAALLALALAWLRGFQLRSRFRRYSAVFEFSQACGICVGTPVRIRGVTVGSVVRVDSSLRSIDAYVEVDDDKIIVPRNSSVEVNQSGLLMETMIDITPKDPLPTPSVGPLDTDCSKEGLILCDKERMKGHQGVSLDALVGIFTRLGRDMEEIGVHKSFKLAEKVASIMEEAQPLLSRIEALAEEAQPLLSEVRDSDLVKDVETIAKGLADASGDLRKLKSSMLTPENSDLIKQSIFTLIFTLKNIESISSDISGFTGEEATRQNIKLLIKSLSRLL